MRFEIANFIELHTTAMDTLSPSQRFAAEELIDAVNRKAPFVALSAQSAGNAGTLTRGMGLTTLLHAVECELTATSAKLLSIQDTVAPSALALQTLDSTDLSKDTWERILIIGLQHLARSDVRVLLVDDVDLLAAPVSIHSTRVGDKGTSHGFYETAGPPVLLTKGLVDEAIRRQKTVVVTYVEGHFLRFIGAPLKVGLPRFAPEDYEHVARPWLSGEPGEEVDFLTLYGRHPQLSPADLRALVTSAQRSSRGACTTDAVLRAASDGLVASGGAIDSSTVEFIDTSKMAGMQTIFDSLETHVLAPFENPTLSREVALRPLGTHACSNLHGGSRAVLPASSPSSPSASSLPVVGAEPKAGVLLYGPPGTGKTSVGRWLAHRLSGKLFMVKELGTAYQMMQTFAQAAACAPSVVFIDDVDVLLQRDLVQYGHQACPQLKR
ncbi:hypothetical protein CYMTET_10086 [Cymbomonas tetramitiformis]|uniref:ATPase AAA-type core domain-containing protein n=1 Tax=Cymbomonas tetramitiformis TaxID=36881 RepID=A0AAE0GQ94_9CHLO|nr:hypothetical protein CYMTET_10086 [Cymbomonas tetramitiformis]